MQFGHFSATKSLRGPFLLRRFLSAFGAYLSAYILSVGHESKVIAKSKALRRHFTPTLEVQCSGFFEALSICSPDCDLTVGGTIHSHCTLCQFPAGKLSIGSDEYQRYLRDGHRRNGRESTRVYTIPLSCNVANYVRSVQHTCSRQRARLDLEFQPTRYVHMIYENDRDSFSGSMT